MLGRHSKAAKEATRMSMPTLGHKIGHESYVKVDLRGVSLIAMSTNSKPHGPPLFDYSTIQPNQSHNSFLTANERSPPLQIAKTCKHLRLVSLSIET